MNQKIAIFGAGSIGCYVGGRLAANGADIVMIGRESYQSWVKTHGLTLTHFEFPQAHVPASNVRYDTDPKHIADCDVIIITVKSLGSAQAAKIIAEYAKSSAVLISLQNGIGNADVIAQNAPGFTVLPAMVPFNVIGLGEGRFHCGTEGTTMIEHAVATEPLCGALIAAGIPTELRTDMTEVLWGKLLLNLGNSANAISGQPYLEQLSDRNHRLVMAEAIDETLRVLSKAGIEPAQIGKAPPHKLSKILRLPNWLYRQIMKRTLKIDAEARSSMWQDFAAGRPSEVDFINGAVVELGIKTGVPTPANRNLMQLTYAMFDSGEPMNLSGKDLLSRIRA